MSPDAGQHAGVTDTQETENEIMPRCARSPGVATPDLRAVNFKPHGRSHHEAGDGANVGSRETSKSDNETQEQAEDACNRDCRFWCVILALCTMQILCSVENMVALANLFGGRHIALVVAAIYTLGSGLTGGANGGAGRAVQGSGSGGMTAIMGIAILAMTYAIGMAIVPVVGGAIGQNTVFYISLKWDKETKAWDKLKRIDVAGNALLVAPTVLVLIALTWAGARNPWASYQILVPLILGLVGLAGFFVLEGSTWVPELVMPPRLFSNRNSAVIYANIFVVSMLNYWVIFFLPLHFQAVQLSTPTRSGVQILPDTLIAVPGAAVGAVALTIWGKYKLLHIIGFSFLPGALSKVFLVGIALQALALILSFVEREVKLRKTLEIEFGLEDMKEQAGGKE
ncbi:unnamed protein product [Clonostachys chloroleuca]|uniref:Uncharacterized protein n=1 Tax=Clonostachys chloroleuca TaxID=1926264 RepID=A0AA35QFI4_9HYPO|nr:unnamed protein product [Clonostachys chloroleuca]